MSKSTSISLTNSLSVSLIVIGDEILNGRTKDLNGSWLSQFLFKHGMELTSMNFIRDNEIEMNAALKMAFHQSDIVITSGGIGPTIDDKTKKVLADFFNQKIIERDEIAHLVEENYLRFGRVWNRGHNHYHLFPEHFIGVKNPLGLAPGLAYFDRNTHKLLLSGPGVPREFMAMNEQEFLPLISKFFLNKFQENQQVVIRTTGVPEEKIFNELCPTLWTDLEQFGKVSSLPHTIGIDIVISFHGDLAVKKNKEKEIFKLIESSAISRNVWQYGNESLPQLVFELAKKQNKTFGFAESCTGGLTSSKITDLSGSSEVFFGSIISYDNTIKTQILNVSEKTIHDFGAVSIECAKEMAMGALKKLNVDYAVSISGIAGPNGATPNKPVGTVAIGIASKDLNQASIFQFPGDRIRLKERFSDMALLSLYELLKK